MSFWSIVLELLPLKNAPFHALFTFSFSFSFHSSKLGSARDKFTLTGDKVTVQSKFGLMFWKGLSFMLLFFCENCSLIELKNIFGRDFFKSTAENLIKTSKSNNFQIQIPSKKHPILAPVDIWNPNKKRFIIRVVKETGFPPRDKLRHKMRPVSSFSSACLGFLAELWLVKARMPTGRRSSLKLARFQAAVVVPKLGKLWRYFRLPGGWVMKVGLGTEETM